MKELKYYTIRLLVALLYLHSAVSCTDAPEETEETVNRLFRPVKFGSSVIENEVSFTWTDIKNASFILEISRDSFDFSTDFQSFVIDTTEYIVGDLWSNSLYSARVKAVSKDPAIKDSEFQTKTFRTKTENIFFTINEDDVSSNTVLLKWNRVKNVSHIIISTSGAIDVTINLSASEISSGQRLIEGLNANTGYVFKIYLNDMLRGTANATTHF